MYETNSVIYRNEICTFLCYKLQFDVSQYCIDMKKQLSPINDMSVKYQNISIISLAQQ